MHANRSITQDTSTHSTGADTIEDVGAPTSFHASTLSIEAAAPASDFTTQDYSLEHLSDKPYYHLIRAKPHYALMSANKKFLYELSKRAIDIVGAFTLLVLTFPVCLCVAILVKVTSPGPVFFRHRRLGRHGKEFWLIKFRTMVVNAEDVLKNDSTLREQFAVNYKIKGDPRIIRCGRFLRRTSLDELPQLWHVLTGEMSLIGPRPVVSPELTRYAIYEKKLLGVKPGVSGFWQACGRSDTTYAERVLMDMQYIDHRCFSLDLQLMLITVAAVLRKSGAY